MVQWNTHEYITFLSNRVSFYCYVKLKSTPDKKEIKKHRFLLATLPVYCIPPPPAQPVVRSITTSSTTAAHAPRAWWCVVARPPRHRPAPPGRGSSTTAHQSLVLVTASQSSMVVVARSWPRPRWLWGAWWCVVVKNGWGGRPPAAARAAWLRSAEQRDRHADRLAGWLASGRGRAAGRGKKRQGNLLQQYYYLLLYFVYFEVFLL